MKSARSTLKRYGLSSHLTHIDMKYICYMGDCVTVDPGKSGTTLAECKAAGCTHDDADYACDGALCGNGFGTQSLAICKSQCGKSIRQFCPDKSPARRGVCNYCVDIPRAYVTTTQRSDGIDIKNTGPADGGGLQYILQPSKSYRSWITLTSTVSFWVEGVPADKVAYVELSFELSKKVLAGKIISANGPILGSGKKGEDNPIVSIAITSTVEMTKQPLIPAPAIRLVGWFPNSRICIQIVSWTFNIMDSVAPFPISPSAPPSLPLPLRYEFNRELIKVYTRAVPDVLSKLAFDQFSEEYFKVDGKAWPYNKGNGVNVIDTRNVSTYWLLPSPSPYQSWITFNSTIFFGWVQPRDADIYGPVLIPVNFYFVIDGKRQGIAQFDLLIEPSDEPVRPISGVYAFTSHSITYTMQMSGKQKPFQVTPAIEFADGIARSFQIAAWTFSFMDSVYPELAPVLDFPRYGLHIETKGEFSSGKGHIRFTETPAANMTYPTARGQGIHIPSQYPTIAGYSLNPIATAPYETWVTLSSDISFTRSGGGGFNEFYFQVNNNVVGATQSYLMNPALGIQTLSITYTMKLPPHNPVTVNPVLVTWGHLDKDFSITVKNWSFNIMDSVAPISRSPPSAYARFSNLTLQGPSPGNGNGDDDSDSKWIWWALLAVVLIVIAFLLIMKRPWRSSATTRTTADTPAGGFGNSHW